VATWVAITVAIHIIVDLIVSFAPAMITCVITSVKNVIEIITMDSTIITMDVQQMEEDAYFPSDTKEGHIIVAQQQDLTMEDLGVLLK